MTGPQTNRDMQRVTFVESLHNSLRKQAAKAAEDSAKFVTFATSYIDDGLSESECVELLMIDGLSREAAESYTMMAVSDKESQQENDGLDSYSFQFEDVYGKVWSSYDIGKIVRASDENEAWAKAEESIDEATEIEADQVISVSRIE